MFLNSVLVANVRCMLALNCNFEVKFIRRQTNMAAHSLARETISYASRQVNLFMILLVFVFVHFLSI